MTAAAPEPPPAPPAPTLDVWCLCAGWCSTCQAIEAEVKAFEAPGVVLHWIDIEEHDDAITELDLETFPTLLVASATGVVLFAGPVDPRTRTWQRLLDGLPSEGRARHAGPEWDAAVAQLQRITR